MVIEQGMYLNAFIRIALIDGTSGQMEVDVEFDKNETLYKIDDSVIKDAFGFPCDRESETTSLLSWNREFNDNNRLEIYWRFMFSTLDHMKCFQKYQFLDSLFASIRKINQWINNNKSNLDNIEDSPTLPI